MNLSRILPGSRLADAGSAGPEAASATAPAAPSRRRGLRRGLATATAAALALGVLPLLPAQAAETTVDGKSSETAAASCWEIKQKDPDSASGTYWLYTPQMSAPAQFYCDQSTDGGGWVLIGRGRENWKETYAGTGSASEIAEHPDGTAAFTTAQLPSQTVDALLNGSAPADLSDGIRLRRALNSTGTDYQEVRFNRKYSPQWSWTFRSQTPVTAYSFTNSRDGVTCDTKGVACRNAYDANYSTTSPGTANIEYFGSSSTKGYNKVLFRESPAQAYVTGFGYDKNVKAPTVSANVGDDSGSYLWSHTTGYAQPFTQMYLRPKTTQSDLTSLSTDAQGVYAGSQRRSLPNSYAEKTTWGATGRANGVTNELNTEVQAFAQVGRTVFVGGNFAKLQSDSSATTTFDQSYVAGLDVDTQQPVDSFRPTVNGQIKTMKEINGKLAIGGEFTEVNGQARAGFAVLDPVTGQLDPDWNDLVITNQVTGGTVQIKDMDVKNGYLYLAGSFTHLDSAGAKNVFSRNAARIALDTKTADRAWNPNFNGTVNGISASSDGTKVFADGYFSQAKGTSAFRIASLNTSDGSQNQTWSWQPSYLPANTATNLYGFQFKIRDTDDGNVWVAGTEHMLHVYDSSSLTRKYSNIARDGGDFQSLSQSGSTIYASCHCGDWLYQGAQYHTVNNSSWTIAHEISLIGAWDQKTGAYLPEFNPQLKGPGGFGVWASMTDSEGNLWAGGSIDKSLAANGRTQWSGGFVRFAPRDTTAPDTPTGLTVAQDGTGDSARDTVSWKGVSGSGVVYQVLRNGRVIGSTTSTSATYQHVDGAQYAVRAMDAAQNYSASTPQKTAAEASASATPTASAEPSTAPATEPSESASASETADDQPTATATSSLAQAATVLTTGATWQYKQGTSAPAADWNQTGSTDTTGWSSGASPLGWGSTGLGTTLDRDASKPVTTYYRTEINRGDHTGDLVLETYADDGLVLYVNGKEVKRANMKDGTVTSTTYATAAPRTATAAKQKITVTVPAADLPATGTVVVAAEVHANYRSTPDSSFDLTATAQPASAAGATASATASASTDPAKEG